MEKTTEAQNKFTVIFLQKDSVNCLAELWQYKPVYQTFQKKHLFP